MSASHSFLKACQRKPVKRVPVWFMRQAGRYMPEYRAIREKHDILTICKTPELAAKITLQPVDVLGVDAAILFSDLLLPLEAMGARLYFAKGEGPVITNALTNPNDIQFLKNIDPEKDLGFVLKAIERARKALKDRVPLISFAGAPFTLASYLIEGGHTENYLKTKMFMYHYSRAWAMLMEKLASISLDFLLAQVAAGSQAVQVFDSWAGTLSEQDYREYVLPYSKIIFDGLRKKKVVAIDFSTGTSGILELVREAGGDVISVDWRIPIDAAWKRLGPAVAIQGNLDPAVLLGPRDIIEKRVKDILSKVGRKPGFIFNLGHGIFPQTPVENVKYVVDLVHAYK